MSVPCANPLYFVVRVGCRRKTVHVRYLISWWASCYYYYYYYERATWSAVAASV